MQRIQSSIKTNVCNSIINRGWDGWDVSLVFFNFCFVSFLLTNELSEMIARSIHACHFYGFFWKCRVLDNFLCNPQTGRVTETTVLSDAHFASNGISQALPLFSKSNSITKHYHMIFQMNILFIVNRNFIRKCSPSHWRWCSLVCLFTIFAHFSNHIFAFIFPYTFIVSILSLFASKISFLMNFVVRIHYQCWWQTKSIKIPKRNQQPDSTIVRYFKAYQNSCNSIMMIFNERTNHLSPFSKC